MKRIITSLLDTDKYKLTMLQERFFHPNGSRRVCWKVTNRTKTNRIDMVKYHKRVVKILKEQIKLMNGMTFSAAELYYLLSDKFHKNVILKTEFIEFLRTFKLNSDVVEIDTNLDIWVKGTWTETTLWETYLLSMYNEIFTQLYSEDNKIDVVGINKKTIKEKIKKLIGKTFPLIEFGTRRRASSYIQEYNLRQLMNCDNFIGTSNMLLSMKYNINCIGTMAHELFMGEAAFAVVDGNDLRASQKIMMKRWNDFYDGELNIFLSDTFGTDAFLEDFKELGYHTDPKNAVRQDSGVPIEFCKKMENFYTSNNTTFDDKMIVYSDGLNFDKSDEIHTNDENKLKDSFGVGTSITNDCGGFPLSLVCKLSYVWDEVNEKWVSTVKLSDNLNKATGEKEMVDLYVKTFNYVNNEKNNETLIY